MDSEKKQGSKPKRETLLARSRRIIGRHLSDDPAKADDSPDGDQSPDSAPSGQKNVSKRRAQVVKAQRTHRRRAQNYILELEKEVLRLRARESELSAELEQWRSRSRSVANEMPTPMSNPQSVTDQSSSPDGLVDIDLTALAHTSPFNTCGVRAATRSEREFVPPSADVLAYSAQTDAAETNQEPRFSMNTQAAIDFVLELERPCLTHIRYDMSYLSQDPFDTPLFNCGIAHACTTSANIIHSHRNIDLASSPFKMPASEIEALLESSKALPLGPEMTPVQVWAILVDISQTYTISDHAFKIVKEEIKKYMRCNSFGTSVPIDTLRKVLEHFFPAYRAPQLYHSDIIGNEEVRDQMNDFAGDGWEEYFWENP